MNLQLDHLPKYDTKQTEGVCREIHFSQRSSHPNPKLRGFSPVANLLAAARLSNIHLLLLSVARPSQRVAMDDLASYFVEERSKVR